MWILFIPPIILIVSLLAGVSLIAYGGFKIRSGEVRLTRRTQLKGAAAKVVSVVYIILGTVIICVVYLTYQLCLSAVAPFHR
jgi:hypothetical protein